MIHRIFDTYPVKFINLATGKDTQKNFLLLRRSQNKDSVAGRFFQCFQECVESGSREHFQHVRVPGSNIDYITNTSGSLSRKVNPIEGTVFCSPEPGFSIVSADKKTLELRMIDKQGNVLHTVTRSK